MATNVLITGNLIVNGTNNICTRTSETTILELGADNSMTSGPIIPVQYAVSGTNNANISVSSGVITINDAGLYIVSGSVVFANNSANNWRQIWTKYGSTRYFNTCISAPVTGNSVILNYGFSKFFNVGDTFTQEAQANFVSGSMAVIGNSTATVFSKMNIDRIQF